MITLIWIGNKPFRAIPEKGRGRNAQILDPHAMIIFELLTFRNLPNVFLIKIYTPTKCASNTIKL